jgi:DNA-binding NarL/FixJ family response regulator
MSEQLLRSLDGTENTRLLATANHLVGIGGWEDPDVSACIAAKNLWKELGEPLWDGMITCTLSRRAREIGNVERAEKYAREAWNILKSTEYQWFTYLTALELARVQQLTGHPDESLRLVKDGIEQISEIGDQIVVIRHLEMALSLIADQLDHERVILLSTVCDRQRKSIGYALKNPSERDAAKQVLAEALFATGTARSEELRLLGESMTIEDAVHQVLEINIAPAPSTATGVMSAYGLTRRELEVLARIVAGKTDQSIADELFVSYRTVTTHVTNILNKLGASSRTEAAAIAVRTAIVRS